MKTTFGLDFGTSNSALAVNHGGKVEVIDIDKHNTAGKTAKSVIYFDEERGVYIGQEAVDRYIENGAAGRFIQSIKSFLPIESFDATLVNNKFYELEELIAIILRKIKSRAEQELNQEIDRVVAGRPAVFSENPEREKLAETRLLTAFAKAGFKEVNFQFEPIAAALTFESMLEPGEERTVFVGDFGGGTSDFAVIKLCGGAKRLQRKDDILAVGGVYVGGDSFDYEIMWHKMTGYFGRGVEYKITGSDNSLAMPIDIMKTLCQWHLIPQLKSRKTLEFISKIAFLAENKQPVKNLLSLIEDNFGFMLFQSIERAKCELSTIQASQIVFREGDLKIREELTRLEFEAIIEERLEKIRSCIKETLQRSNLSPSQIDSVFITGGSSHIPCIRKIIKDLFGQEKMQFQDAFTSVAYGLGVSASMFFD